MSLCAQTEGYVCLMIRKKETERIKGCMLTLETSLTALVRQHFVKPN